MGEMKRIAAPRFWKIQRKAKKYVMCPNPGPHAKEHCLPLGVLLRDYLRICENQKDVSSVLNKNMVSINGKIRRDRKFPIGMMDIVTIKDVSYRMISSKKGIEPKEVSDSNLRLCKIMGKKTLKGGKVQINLSAGENMLVDGKESYNTGDVLVFDISKKQVESVLKLDKGSLVIITGGKNMGEFGIVESIEVIKNPLPTLVTLKLGERSVKVPKDYVFAVGKDKPFVEM